MPFLELTYRIILSDTTKSAKKLCESYYGINAQFKRIRLRSSK